MEEKAQELRERFAALDPEDRQRLMLAFVMGVFPKEEPAPPAPPAAPPVETLQACGHPFRDAYSWGCRGCQSDAGTPCGDCKHSWASHTGSWCRECNAVCPAYSAMQR